MSQIFKAGGRTLLNPSTGVAFLFFRTAEVMADDARVPTGIGPNLQDEYELDLPTYGAFVNALVERRLNSAHRVLSCLLDGFLPPAIAIARHGGVGPAGLEPPPGDPRAARIAARLEGLVGDVAWRPSG